EDGAQPRCERRRRVLPWPDRAYLGASAEISTASVQVMSRRSPTLTFLSASLSSTRELYFHPFGPLNEIDGTFGSIWVIVAVMVRCMAAVHSAFAPVSGGTLA